MVSEQSLIDFISGFQPQMTGGICDSCNAGLVEGDTVRVLAYYDEEREWYLVRTHCENCFESLDTGPAPSGVAECELGASPDGEFYPLYNPEVVAFESE